MPLDLPRGWHLSAHVGANSLSISLQKGLESLQLTLNEKNNKQYRLLYSWRFSHYSVPFHWLVHGHMTSNNETVSRQMP